VLTLALAACAGGPSDTTSSSATDRATVAQNARSNPEGVDRAALSEIYGVMSARYQTEESAVDLASSELVDLGLVGTVASYEAGPNLFPGESGVGGDTAIMRIDNKDVFDGVEPSAGVRVLIRLPSGTLGDLEAALPTGSPVAFYLSKSPQSFPDFPGPLYLAVTPQGFITEDADGSVFPYDTTLDVSEPLDEQVPEGTDVPN
jgi:hypothetical protein